MQLLLLLLVVFTSHVCVCFYVNERELSVTTTTTIITEDVVVHQGPFFVTGNITVGAFGASSNAPAAIINQCTPISHTTDIVSHCAVIY